MTRSMLATLVAVATLFGVGTQRLAAQTDTVAVTGVVLDSSTASLLADVELQLEGEEWLATTDSLGFFRIFLPPGAYKLRLFKIGFRSANVPFDVDSQKLVSIDLGRRLLSPLPSLQIQMTGTVNERGTGAPVPRAAIVVNGNLVAMTDASGTFAARSMTVYTHENHLSVQALGFHSVEQFFDVGQAEQADRIHIELSLEPSPVELEPVTIEDAAVARHLRGFERRRREGFGDFVTSEQIEQWNSASTSDVLRRMSGVDVVGDPESGVRIRIHGAGYFCRVGAGPAIFVDGVLAPNAELDFLLQPERIAGIEVYRGPAAVPPEFNVIGSQATQGMSAVCGVVALWTKAPAIGELASPFEFGLRYGADLADAGFEFGRFGVHLVVPFAGPVEFYPAWNIITNVPSPEEGFSNSGWHAQVALRLRPLQNLTAWTLGAGLVLEKPTVKFEGEEVDTLNISDVDPAYTIFSGLALQIGSVRPFVELHLLDLFSFTDIRSQLFFGLGVQFYGRRRRRPVT